MIAARLAGISVFATGGIGGVHAWWLAGGSHTMRDNVTAHDRSRLTVTAVEAPHR